MYHGCTVPAVQTTRIYTGRLNLPFCRRCRSLKFSQGDSSGHLRRFGANLTAHDRSQEGDAIALEDWCWAMHRFSHGQGGFEFASAPLSDRRPRFAQALTPLELRCRIGKCLDLC